MSAALLGAEGRYKQVGRFLGGRPGMVVPLLLCILAIPLVLAGLLNHFGTEFRQLTGLEDAFVLVVDEDCTKYLVVDIPGNDHLNAALFQVVLKVLL